MWNEEGKDNCKTKSVAFRLKLVSESSGDYKEVQDYLTSPRFLETLPKFPVLPSIREDVLEHLDATLHLLKSCK